MSPLSNAETSSPSDLRWYEDATWNLLCNNQGLSTDTLMLDRFGGHGELDSSGYDYPSMTCMGSSNISMTVSSHMPLLPENVAQGVSRDIMLRHGHHDNISDSTFAFSGPDTSYVSID